MEAGLVSEIGPLALTVTVQHGLDFEGGHFETNGLSGTGQVVTVPRHRHDVSLDFWRLELGLARRLSERRSVRARLPYDVKRRSARLELVDPATEGEIDSMQRNLDLHHPSTPTSGNLRGRAATSRPSRSPSSFPVSPTPSGGRTASAWSAVTSPPLWWETWPSSRVNGTRALVMSSWSTSTTRARTPAPGGRTRGCRPDQGARRRVRGA